MPPLLKDIVGPSIRSCNMIVSLLPLADANVPFRCLSGVAKWYQVTKLPGDSRQHRSLVLLDRHAVDRAWRHGTLCAN